LQVLSRKGFIKALGLRQVIEVRNIFFGVFALSHHNLGEPNVSQTDSCTVDAVDDLANLNEDFSDQLKPVAGRWCGLGAWLFGNTIIYLWVQLLGIQSSQFIVLAFILRCLLVGFQRSHVRVNLLV
jgi:hypothetical protein